MAEHFAQPPDWTWYILGYFFCAGIAGGLYTLATLRRLAGAPRGDRAVRVAHLWVFPLIVLCAIFLTIDLGQPLRFWHMMINTTPNETGLNFKYWSPISLGTWALLIFGIFSFVSFVEALVLGRGGRVPALSGGLGTLWDVVGSLFAIFLASYTGVVLSVSNQPVWSDSWAVGALFVASAFSGSAALLALIERTPGTSLAAAERYFAVIEIVLIALFFWTLASAGTLAKTFSGVWIVLWILVVISLIPALFPFGRTRRMQVSGGGTVSVQGAAAAMSPPAALIVIVGVLLMRYVVIFSAQS